MQSKAWTGKFYPAHALQGSDMEDLYILFGNDINAIRDRIAGLTQSQKDSFFSIKSGYVNVLEHALGSFIYDGKAELIQLVISEISAALLRELLEHSHTWQGVHLVEMFESYQHFKSFVDMCNGDRAKISAIFEHIIYEQRLEGQSLEVREKVKDFSNNMLTGSAFLNAEGCSMPLPYKTLVSVQQSANYVEFEPTPTPATQIAVSTHGTATYTCSSNVCSVSAQQVCSSDSSPEHPASDANNNSATALSSSWACDSRTYFTTIEPTTSPAPASQEHTIDSNHDPDVCPASDAALTHNNTNTGTFAKPTSAHVDDQTLNWFINYDSWQLPYGLVDILQPLELMVSTTTTQSTADSTSQTSHQQSAESTNEAASPQDAAAKTSEWAKVDEEPSPTPTARSRTIEGTDSSQYNAPIISQHDNASVVTYKAQPFRAFSQQSKHFSEYATGLYFSMLPTQGLSYQYLPFPQTVSADSASDHAVDFWQSPLAFMALCSKYTCTPFDATAITPDTISKIVAPQSSIDLPKSPTQQTKHDNYSLCLKESFTFTNASYTPSTPKTNADTTIVTHSKTESFIVSEQEIHADETATEPQPICQNQPPWYSEVGWRQKSPDSVIVQAFEESSSTFTSADLHRCANLGFPVKALEKKFGTLDRSEQYQIFKESCAANFQEGENCPLSWSQLSVRYVLPIGIASVAPIIGVSVFHYGLLAKGSATLLGLGVHTFDFIFFGDKFKYTPVLNYMAKGAAGFWEVIQQTWPYALTLTLFGNVVDYFGEGTTAKTIFRDFSKVGGTTVQYITGTEKGHMGIKYGIGDLASATIKPLCKGIFIVGTYGILSNIPIIGLFIAPASIAAAAELSNYPCEVLVAFPKIVEKDKQNSNNHDVSFTEYLCSGFTWAWVFRSGAALFSKAGVADQIDKRFMKNSGLGAARALSEPSGNIASYAKTYISAKTTGQVVAFNYDDGIYVSVGKVSAAVTAAGGHLHWLKKIGLCGAFFIPQYVKIFVEQIVLTYILKTAMVGLIDLTDDLANKVFDFGYYSFYPKTEEILTSRPISAEENIYVLARPSKDVAEKCKNVPDLTKAEKKDPLVAFKPIEPKDKEKYLPCLQAIKAAESAYWFAHLLPSSNPLKSDINLELFEAQFAENHIPSPDDISHAQFIGNRPLKNGIHKVIADNVNKLGSGKYNVECHDDNNGNIECIIGAVSENPQQQ